MNFEKYQPLTEKYADLSDSQMADLMDQFRNEALMSVGLWGHPEADKTLANAWKNAWEFGIEEVFEHLDMMADIILDTGVGRKLDS